MLILGRLPDISTVVGMDSPPTCFDVSICEKWRKKSGPRIDLIRSSVAVATRFLQPKRKGRSKPVAPQLFPQI